MSASVYTDLGLRPFINARGTITTLGGSLMPPAVIAAMAAAARHFIPLNELQAQAGARIAALTDNEAAFICAGAASGLLLSGAACLTGTDQEAIQNLPDVGDRPNEFVISLVDSHYNVHQGFRVSGGVLKKVGTPQQVTAQDYAAGITDRTAAVVFFLGSQAKEDLPEIIAVAHQHNVPVIVDAAAQLPPRSNLSDLTGMGADLVVFSGGKGLFGPQSTGLILGRKDLIEACAINSNPHSAIGRSMKVGKEEIIGLLKAVELFMEQDEEAVIKDWEQRCFTIAAAVKNTLGITADYQPPYTNKFPPASPMLSLRFTAEAPLSAPQAQAALESGDPSILAGGSTDTLSFGPQTLEVGEAELIAKRLAELVGANS